MNYKGLFKSVLGLALIMVLGTFMSSCGEDTPAPDLKLYITIDGNIVNIAAEADNVDTWSWDYGDGTVSDSVGSHTHTYLSNDTYTIKCVVTGVGGSDTKSETVTIETMQNLLTAHPWVMSNAGANNGLGFHINSALVMDFPVADILTTLNGLIDDASDMVYDFTNEYNDTYTFNTDGSYNVDYDNNNVLTSWVYAPTDKIVGTCKYVGMFVVSQEPLQGATWTLHENENLTLNTVYDADGDNADGVAETVTFENVDFITFTNGGFLGVKDYTSTALIRSINPDELEVTVFFHGYNDGTLGIDEPSFILNFTYKAK